MKVQLKTLTRVTLLSAFLATAALNPIAALAEAHATGDHGRDHGRKMDPAKMHAMMDKHLAELKTKLQISPAQEGAWISFTQAMKPPAQGMDAKPDRAAMEKLSTPERMDKMRAMRALRAAEMDKHEDAAKAFYAQLTPEQKKTFDAAAMRMMGRGGKGGPGGMHG